MSNINCAVYIRKSTEKGLEQEFNSLHNQEDACKSYIASQAFNNWKYYKTYEDGGISGGTMKRPGLLDMMEDIKSGLVQTVVVYKVDRLSRSIIDFHNMMKEFEKYDCNFVSITQAFDTSNSMGKLTLNMLLSFAQFERELSSERVRHKIAASKSRGLWTGGIHPLGYDVKDKKLIVNKEEARSVRILFEKYVELNSMTKLRDYLETTSIRAKSWINAKGVRKGGKLLTISMIARMLRDPVYTGKIENKKTNEVFDGVHEPIVSNILFKRVQTMLGGNKARAASRGRKNYYLLRRKLVDSDGRVFKGHKNSKKSIKKYRYYILKGTYLPAGDIEKITAGIVKDFLNYDLKLLLPKAKILEFKSLNFDALTMPRQHKFIRELVSKVVYYEDKLVCFIDIENLSWMNNFKPTDYMNGTNNIVPGSVFSSEDKRHIVIVKEIFINNRVSTNRYDACGKIIMTKKENNHGLIKALAYGWRYKKLYEKGLSIAKIRMQEHKTERTIYKYLNLAYLSPKIVNNIMESKVPGHIDLQKLFHISSKYVDFKSQEEQFYSE